MKKRDSLASATKSSSLRGKSHSSQVNRSSATIIDNTKLGNSISYTSGSIWGRLSESSRGSHRNNQLTRSGRFNLSTSAFRSPKKQLLSGCVECGQPNIKVKYYGQRHLCVSCRGQLVDDCGRQIRLYLDRAGNIVVLGLHRRKDGVKEYSSVSATNLYIGSQRYQATYADTFELIVLPMRTDTPAEIR